MSDSTQKKSGRFAMETELARDLGLMAATTIIIGGIIGSGIFGAPAGIAQAVGSPGLFLLVWLVGGIVSFSGALCFAELGSMMPRSGGQVIYLREAYPPIIAFLYGWVEVIVIEPASLAAIAMIFADYLGYFVPVISLDNVVIDMGVQISTQHLAVFVVIGLLGAINYYGVRFGGLISNLSTVAKVSALLALVVSMAPSGAGGLNAQEQDVRYSNLQVLPPDISQDELGDTMLGFLSGLGLRRRAGVGCLHCHVGDIDVPRSQWDYASDAKPAKETARRMIAMVRAINEEHLAGLVSRQAPDLTVGCYTCHAGRLDPRPLTDVLAGAYTAAGADSVAVVYRALHQRYFGSDAYDFRVGVLARMAGGLAESDAYEDALVLARVNEETHPDDASARRATVSLRVQEALDRDGVDAALARFGDLRRSEPADVLTFSVLDGIGWRTFRLDRQAEALPLFRANRDAFPESYFTFESLSEALHAAGEIDRDEIIRRYESYLEENPGHSMAEAQLTNHRRRN